MQDKQYASRKEGNQSARTEKRYQHAMPVKRLPELGDCAGPWSTCGCMDSYGNHGSGKQNCRENHRDHARSFSGHVLHLLLFLSLFCIFIFLPETVAGSLFACIRDQTLSLRSMMVAEHRYMITAKTSSRPLSISMRSENEAPVPTRDPIFAVR